MVWVMYRWPNHGGDVTRHSIGGGVLAGVHWSWLTGFLDRGPTVYDGHHGAYLHCVLCLAHENVDRFARAFVSDFSYWEGQKELLLYVRSLRNAWPPACWVRTQQS